MSLNSFNVAIDRFIAERVPERVGLLTRAIALQALRECVMRTPVDTGRARSNWQVSVAERVNDQVPPAAPGRKLGLSEEANATPTIDAGKEVIDTAKPFQSIFVQNNVAYIEALESGSSTQSPGGMLAVTIAEIQAQFA